MRPKSIDRQTEKRSAVRSVVVSTLLQLMMAGTLLYLRTLGPPDWHQLAVRPDPDTGHRRCDHHSLYLCRPVAEGTGD